MSNKHFSVISGTTHWTQNKNLESTRETNISVLHMWKHIEFKKEIFKAHQKQTLQCDRCLKTKWESIWKTKYFCVNSVKTPSIPSGNWESTWATNISVWPMWKHIEFQGKIGKAYEEQIF